MCVKLMNVSTPSYQSSTRWFNNYMNKSHLDSSSTSSVVILDSQIIRSTFYFIFYIFVYLYCTVVCICRALEGLRQILPASLRDDTFKSLIDEDSNTTKFYEDLMTRLA